jgi:site-specific recombinase XerD
MKGTRPLTTDEIRAVSKQFDGDFAIRNRSLFMLGVSVGGRISELLALTIGDVWQNNQPVSDLLFEKDIVKGCFVTFHKKHLHRRPTYGTSSAWR